jgi:cystathionine gamma-lyase
MAAVDAVLGTTLRPGDAVVLAADCYYTIRRLVAGWFERLGIEVRLVPTRGNAQLGALDGARLVWVETPTNPQLDICDIASMVEAAHARGVTVSVDNTTATPYLQQPLALGADFVVASDAKAITGHSDLILGHVATRDEEKLNALRTWRTQHGAIAGPMEVWLAHRSLPTLPCASSVSAIQRHAWRSSSPRVAMSPQCTIQAWRPIQVMRLRGVRCAVSARS